MEISVQEFLGQLGPEFQKYTNIFLENEFKDNSSLRAMDIDQDLDLMFACDPLPLGHKRKIQLALRNLVSATNINSDAFTNLPGTFNTNMQVVNETNEGKSSMDKVKEKCLDDLKLKEKELKDLQNKRKSLDVIICDPEPVGPFKSTRCGNCHLRGHKADGNRGNKSCTFPACNSWKDCGQKDKHPEHKRECKQIEKDIKHVEKEVDDIKIEMCKLSSFKEKSSTSFIAVMKDRLRETNRHKYMNTNILMRDVIALKDFYRNIIPTHPPCKDQEEFENILKDTTKESTAKFKLYKESSFYEDVSDDECEPPTKKTRPKPTATVTSPQQSADMSYNYNPYSFFPSYYGFNPYYYSTFAYQQNLQMQPPLPIESPPKNPPLPLPDSD